MKKVSVYAIICWLLALMFLFSSVSLLLESSYGGMVNALTFTGAFGVLGFVLQKRKLEQLSAPPDVTSERDGKESESEVPESPFLSHIGVPRDFTDVLPQDGSGTPSQCEPIRAKVAAASFGNRQQFLRKCAPGHKVFLLHDRNNEYSEHAIAVYAEIDGMCKRLGYLNDDLAAKIYAKHIESFSADRDVFPFIEGQITEITESVVKDKPVLDCLIQFFACI